MHTGYIHSIDTFGSVDGPGVRFVVFMQGCLMRCRYCIRHALNICPKQGKLRGEKIKPTPLKLRNGKIELTAHFHCKPCEMSLTTKV
jgi:pyruvate-formate lyase-activating enzyme